MIKNGLFLILVLSLGMVGCKKKAAAVVDTGTGSGESSNGVLTTTSVAGSITSSCRTISAGPLAGKSFYDGYTLQSNGNYNYWMTSLDSGNCTGLELVRYTQFGTYSFIGVATTPATASKVKFSVGSAAFNVPDATFRTYFNTSGNCGGVSLNLVGSSNSTTSTSGVTCTSYSPFPTNTSDYYNVFIKTGSSLQAYSGTTLWDSGTAGSYPASVNTTYHY